MSLKTKNNDLASLESSLAATEQEVQTDPGAYFANSCHPSWVYYYITCLSLLLFLAILFVAGLASQTEQSVFVSLNESSVRLPSPKPVVEETSLPIAKEQPHVEETELERRKTTETVAPDLITYHFFTPEELQMVSNQILSNSSEGLSIIKAEVFSFLGWYNGLQKSKKDGMDFANRSLLAKPQDFRTQRAMALAYIANDQYQKARTILDVLRSTKPDSILDWMDGYTQIMLGRVQTGMSKLEQARKSDPLFYPTSYVLMHQYLKQNKNSQAFEIAQYWKTKSLTNLSFVHIMADVLDRQQQYIELVYYLSPFGAMYPKDWVVLFYLGKANSQLQKKGPAKTYLKKILDSQENYVVDQIGKAYFEFGKILLSENNYEDGIQNLVQASQRLPSDSNIRLTLANAYIKNENYEKAIDVYQQILVKEQNNLKIRIYLGMAYFELGQFTTAEKNLILALNQGSTEPLLMYYLAKVEEQKGDTAKAKEYLLKVLSMEPKHLLATKMLEKLNATTVPTSSP